MNRRQSLAIVTGGAGPGIGSGIVRTLVRDGWDVVIADRDERLGHRLANELLEQGYRASFISVDLTDKDCPRRIVDASLERGVEIRALVNNAGIGCIGPLADLTDEQFDQTFDVNTRAAFRLVREVVRHFPQQAGAIVNIASVHGRQPLPGFSIYAATKGAMEAFTRGAWAVELGPRNIRVNCVVPGMVDCPQTRTGMAKYTENVDSYLEEWTKKRQLLPQLVTSDDVGELVAFLVGPRSFGITGQSILIDAGTTIMLTDRD